MKHVYVGNNDVCRYFVELLNSDILKIYPDFDEFLSVNSQDKFAVFHFSGIPETNGEDLEDKRQSLIDKLDRLGESAQSIIFSSEMLAEDVKVFKQYQRHYFLCGFIEDLKTTAWMDWFYWTTQKYIQDPEILSGLNPYIVKPLTFDILLGLKKSHRDQIYEYVTKNNLQDRVVLTYYQYCNAHPLLSRSKDQWIMGVDDIDAVDDHIENMSIRATYSACPIKYHGKTIPMSAIIPTAIYNQTAYTIVAETKADSEYTFYTEKIVKPIMAERLFIVFAGRYYLNNLRSLGFQTFDGIIDESYDSIRDPNTRFAMALEQMHKLIDRPQQEILSAIQSITQHNKQLMMSTRWDLALTDGMRKIFGLQ